MARILRLCFCLLLAFWPDRAHGADRWAELKLGMTADETVTAIGAPLVRSIGRGFELWIYDNHAEVLFFGDLIGWSTPGVGPGAGHTADVWQANPGQDDFRAVLVRLPAPRGKRGVPRVAEPDRREIAWRPALRFRH